MWGQCSLEEKHDFRKVGTVGPSPTTGSPNEKKKCLHP